MQCHVCGADAVARCYNCGQLMCAAHGQKNCTRCENGIAAGDPRPDRIRRGVAARSDHQAGWWRPQEAETYTPPACYACGGLCRAVCRVCLAHYCRAHAGPNGLCHECGKGSWLGLIILAVLLAFMAGLMLWGWLSRW